MHIRPRLHPSSINFTVFYRAPVITFRITIYSGDTRVREFDFLPYRRTDDESKKDSISFARARTDTWLSPAEIVSRTEAFMTFTREEEGEECEAKGELFPSCSSFNDLRGRGTAPRRVGPDRPTDLPTHARPVRRSIFIYEILSTTGPVI